MYDDECVRLCHFNMCTHYYFTAATIVLLVCVCISCDVVHYSPIYFAYVQKWMCMQELCVSVCT